MLLMSDTLLSSRRLLVELTD